MTEYYGNSDDRRLQIIGAHNNRYLNDPTTDIGFIKSKGMLMEYTLKRYEEGYVDCGKKGRIKNCDRCTWYFDSRSSNLKKIEYEGNSYWVGVRKNLCDDYYEVYKELPKFINDDNFKWRNNEKYKALETTLTSGVFEFYCIARESGDAFISVRYAKCENRHRNKVTLAEINVYNASNEAILEAIREWKAEFIEDMRA